MRTEKREMPFERPSITGIPPNVMTLVTLCVCGSPGCFVLAVRKGGGGSYRAWGYGRLCALAISGEEMASSTCVVRTLTNIVQTVVPVFIP